MFFTLQWYASLNETGTLDLVSNMSAPQLSVRSGGYLILLHDQDAFGKLTSSLYLQVTGLLMLVYFSVSSSVTLTNYSY